MSCATASKSRIEAIVEAFENGTIEAGEFDHESHTLVAWHYLQDLPLLDAIARFTCAVKRLAVKLGAPGKYHETITWFYLVKIAERCSAEPGADWAAFKAANPDLFDRDPMLVDKYYSRSLLHSATARRLFVLPDRRAALESPRNQF